MVVKGENSLKLVLRSYDYRLLDHWAGELTRMAKTKNITVSGPVPFPTRKKIFTICRSVHVDKDSREQFELRVHKRLVIFSDYVQDDLSEIVNMRFPEGIHVSVKR